MKKLSRVFVGFVAGVLMSVSVLSVNVFGDTVKTTVGSKERSYASVKLFAELTKLRMEFENKKVYLNTKLDIEEKDGMSIEITKENLTSRIQYLIAEQYGERVAVDPANNIEPTRREYAISRLTEIEAELTELNKKLAELEALE